MLSGHGKPSSFSRAQSRLAPRESLVVRDDQVLCAALADLGVSVIVIRNVDARVTIPAFDAYLAERGLKLRATVIGGAALQLMGVIARPTKDCDVLDPALSPGVLEAADGFASQSGGALERGWLNNGPASLLRTLPPGWSERRQLLYAGSVLELHTLGRDDLLRSKLFALVDRNIDLPDCVALAPTRSELHALLPWLEEQDGNSEWPAYVRTVVARLAAELGYEL